MNNEYSTVTATYVKHDRYVLAVTIEDQFVAVPTVSLKTLEPLDCCTSGDEITIRVQSWILINNELSHLITGDQVEQ